VFSRAGYRSIAPSTKAAASAMLAPMRFIVNSIATRFWCTARLGKMCDRAVNLDSSHCTSRSSQHRARRRCWRGSRLDPTVRPAWPRQAA